MAYLKNNNSLLSRPGNQDLGLDSGDLTGAAGKVLDFFGAGIKAQGAREALEAQLAQQNAANAQRSGSGGGISTTTMLIGGALAVGALVFMMKRK